MGKRIRELKGRVNSVIKDGGQLRLFHDLSGSDNQPSTSSDRSGAQFRRGSAVLEEDQRAVGLEEKKKEIERLLDQPAVGVLAIVGMGGLGKTFLMQHVYHKIKQRYDHSAWISVSQSCSLRTLLCDLAKQIDLGIESGLSDELVADLIYGHLEGKKWLVVLDDVWGSSVQGDIKRRLGLSTGSNEQCKLVTTTRSRDVATNIKAHHIYDLQQLSKEDSWSLFCLFAFSNSEGNRPPQPDLERLGLQIVEKCGGIPLAVKTVASSMSRYEGVGEWESKFEGIERYTSWAQDSTMQILKLSYNSLPSHLKCCFAYFSFFPEDILIFTGIASYEEEEIDQEYLINLWIAEGFTTQHNEKEQWEIGLDYLHELVNLCLLEVDTLCPSYNVHDLLHDLAINISKEDMKCEFNLPLQERSSRRLVLCGKGISNDALSEKALHRQQLLRTISLFDNPEITSIPQHLFDSLRLLRVLDLSCTAISTLPKSVGKLKLLRLLNLSRTKIREVPGCVRRLKSLLFLHLSFCTSLQLLPRWIGELSSLTYLDARTCSEELVRHMPKGISHLASLRTLRSDFITLSTKENELLNIKDLHNLTNLQEIWFALEDVGVLQGVEDDGMLERLTKVRILGVCIQIPKRVDYKLPAFPGKMNAILKDLQRLTLGGFSVPSWMCGMTNLTQLTLIVCSDYPSLQNMPNLNVLRLFMDSRCRELPNNFGERGGFPKLLKLSIIDFPNLEELPALEDGAMQSLQAVRISNCPRVKKFGEGWERLRRLQHIRIRESSEELEERVKEGGEDFNKIKANNPHVDIDVS